MIIVVTPRSWKNIRRWNINLANIPKIERLYSKSKSINVLVEEWSKVGQQQKYTWTTPKMMKDGEQQKDENVDKEWQNNNKQ
jgi:hypothetical protein